MKLSIVLAVVALTASCKDKQATPAASRSPQGSAAPSAPPPPVLPDDGLPADCVRYSEAIEKLTTCSALPQQTRDALKQAYDAAAAKWANVPKDGKATLATNCKLGADALDKTLTSCK
jgi:hypothetical protein